MQPTPPETVQHLMARARSLSGHSVASLAQKVGWVVPTDLRRHKGWVGQLLECGLGATASNRPEPDFQHLGIELKTLPINARGMPKESTYVCHIALEHLSQETWMNSLVRKKLACVCWIPIEADAAIALPNRKIGMPMMYSLTPEDEAVLRVDWQELTDRLAMGNVDDWDAHLGRWLQIRPKAANSQARCRGVTESGRIQATLPKGFYLRTVFTARLLQHYW